jgi:hypothetical protein
MAFFSKKKKTMPQAPGSPVEQIMALRQQGMDNNQVIQEMERQGYNSSQIFDALNQINISGPEMPQTAQYGQQQNFAFDQPFPQEIQEQPEISKDQIEEIAEAIIDEKWKEFEEDVKKIVDWKDNTEVRINNLEQQIKDLTNSLNALHKNLISKITDYDKNIMNVGTEIKAMEKVFQKVLPSLTENVNKLDRMTRSSKLNKS